MKDKVLITQCCIVGGGPAGIMLGYLLAQCGIKTVILEKWGDFLRDFRGDTIHPSTMEILAEIGILDDFLSLPHDVAFQISAGVGSNHVTLADFSRLKVRCPFIAFMPQWDFLNFLSEKGRKFPDFQLLMNAEATNLIEEKDRIVGVRARLQDDEIRVLADVVVLAEGRNSTLRNKAGLKVESVEVPIDVLWFPVSRKETDPQIPIHRIIAGRMMVLVFRGDFWQCGFVIAKGGLDEIKQKGVQWFRDELLRLAPFLGDRVNEVHDLDRLSLLSVSIDHLSSWYRHGLVCIGDAAHAMSPIGGVGINLAIQDAVATANILAPRLLQQGPVSIKTLAAIQKRRECPARAIQWIQILLQNHLIYKVLSEEDTSKLPRLFSLFKYFPFLGYIPARIIGMGLRPEHVSSLVLGKS